MSETFNRLGIVRALGEAWGIYLEKAVPLPDALREACDGQPEGIYEQAQAYFDRFIEVQGDRYVPVNSPKGSSPRPLHLLYRDALVAARKDAGFEGDRLACTVVRGTPETWVKHINAAHFQSSLEKYGQEPFLVFLSTTGKMMAVPNDRIVAAALFSICKGHLLAYAYFADGLKAITAALFDLHDLAESRFRSDT